MALKVSLVIPPNEIKAIPSIPIDATEEEAALIQLEINKATAHNIGDVFPESYARIMYVRSMAEQSFIWVLWYASEAARVADELPIKSQEFIAETPSLTGDIYPAAYSFLKTLPEFSGAIDC